MREIEQIIPAGYCSRCRGCCRFSQQQGPWLPHLLDTEKALQPDVAVVAQQSAGEAAFRCVSLDMGTNACAIYESRPFECRLYPFVLNTRDAKFFLSVDPNCPFVKESQGTEAFTGHAVRLGAYLQKADARAVLAKNRHLFQPYPGVRDICELIV
jgi:Fe-S-cluster containining protein